jgi:hypothetical protein
MIKGNTSSKSSLDLNVNDVPAIIKQWMSLNQTRSHSEIKENSIQTLFDGADRKILLSKLETTQGNILNDVSTPISEENSTLK